MVVKELQYGRRGSDVQKMQSTKICGGTLLNPPQTTILFPDIMETLGPYLDSIKSNINLC